MRRTKPVWMLAAVLVIHTSAGGRARGELALDFTDGSVGMSGLSGTLGWSFTVNSTITIGSLGLWNEGSQALHSSHDVGLWTGTGSLLATTTITTASSPVPSNSGDGQWLFNTITPLTLNPGSYVIGAQYAQTDPDQIRALTTATTISQITFEHERDIGSSSLAFPTNSFPSFDAGIFGPNLLTTAVPEPSSAIIAVFDAVGVIAYGWSRHRCQQRRRADAGRLPSKSGAIAG
jgi:hypothetical protein